MFFSEHSVYHDVDHTEFKAIKILSRLHNDVVTFRKYWCIWIMNS